MSGGEALLQIEFVTELFKIAKKEGVHTTLDTSGNPFTFEEPFISKFNELMAVTDLFMLDIKHIDDEKHKKLTGWTNKNILDMAKYLSDNNKDMWIRHVLVPKVTDDKEDLQALSDFVKSLKTVKRFEILPYHTLGVFKWHDLGVKYELEDIMPPTKEEIQRADDILKAKLVSHLVEDINITSQLQLSRSNIGVARLEAQNLLSILFVTDADINVLH